MLLTPLVTYFFKYKIPSNPCMQILNIKTKHWHIVANHLIHRCLSCKSKHNLTLQYNYLSYFLLFPKVLKMNICKQEIIEFTLYKWKVDMFSRQDSQK